MRIVALHAIPDRGRMHRLGRIGFLFVVAAQAEGLGSRSREFYAGDVFGDADFMATQAAGRDRRMHRLAFGLVCVALQTLRSINILVQRNRMRLPKGRERCHGDEKKRREDLGENSPPQRIILSRAPCDLWDHATLAFARAFPNLDRPAGAD